jgi:hypothetical protein
MGPTATHVVLLGDSIFDNGAYTGGEPDVASSLLTVLPGGWHATLCAVDGAMVADLAQQLPRIPDNGSHVIVAIGGNDALRNSDLLSLRVESSIEVWRTCVERIENFERVYRSAIGALVELNFKTFVCTIYNGALDADVADIARVALMPFNDVIIRTAGAFGADVIELREVCTEPADYVNKIEPSGRGGHKIARAIAAAVGTIESPVSPIRVWRGASIQSDMVGSSH